MVGGIDCDGWQSGWWAPTCFQTSNQQAVHYLYPLELELSSGCMLPAQIGKFVDKFSRYCDKYLLIHKDVPRSAMTCLSQKHRSVSNFTCGFPVGILSGAVSYPCSCSA